MKKIYIITLSLFISVFAFAQIPNNSFEDWSDMGNYDDPDSWSCLNALTNEMSVYTCTKGTPGNPGSAYMKLTSKTVTGMGVAPGVAVCGEMNMSTMTPLSGIPFSDRPETFEGKWQHMIFGNSQGFLDVTLTKWNTMSNQRETIANAHQNLSGMAMSWANFSIEFNYESDSNPDSCIIFLSASGNSPTNNDYLWVDNLSFQGQAVGVENSVSNLSEIEIFPNPATDFLQVNLKTTSSQFVVMQLMSLNGSIITQTKMTVAPGSSTQRFNTAELAQGIYFLKIIADSKISTHKIVIK